jgi:gamma-glutamylcyclotransferase (GGCT)/AIG2-like uncharacterized protein YtfP
MPLCFAYGANMHVADMARRCPGSRPLGLARLPRRRWFITADGYASVRPDPKAAVHGVLWELALADVAALDRFEGVSRGLYRKLVQPVITPDGPRRALVYVGTETREGGCSAAYRETVLEAARHWRLPAGYVAQIEAAMSSRPAKREPGSLAG